MTHKDTDKIIADLTDLQTEWGNSFTADGIRMAKEIVENAPTADVVPKSEVERLENTYSRAVRKADKKAIVAIQNAKQEVAREIFEAINEDCFDQFGYFEYEAYAELKKKYTEGESNNAE